MARSDTSLPTATHIRCQNCDKLCPPVLKPFNCNWCEETLETMGVSEIAEVLGVSRQRAHQITQKPNFPLPFLRLMATPVWGGGDVRHWMRETGRAKKGSETAKAVAT